MAGTSEFILNELKFINLDKKVISLIKSAIYSC